MHHVRGALLTCKSELSAHDQRIIVAPEIIANRSPRVRVAELDTPPIGLTTALKPHISLITDCNGSKL